MPTKQLLAQMRYRPWNGVFLSDEYLGSVPAAEKITHRILQTYHNAGVVPLVESRVASSEDLQRVEGMLENAAGVPRGTLRQHQMVPRDGDSPCQPVTPNRSPCESTGHFGTVPQPGGRTGTKKRTRSHV